MIISIPSWELIRATAMHSRLSGNPDLDLLDSKAVASNMRGHAAKTPTEPCRLDPESCRNRPEDRPSGIIFSRRFVTEAFVRGCGARWIQDCRDRDCMENETLKKWCALMHSNV